MRVGLKQNSTPGAGGRETYRHHESLSGALMKQLKEVALQALVWFIVGACVMAGMKAVDWLIPNPPRDPIRLELSDTEQPTTHRKHRYLEG